MIAATANAKEAIAIRLVFLYVFSISETSSPLIFHCNNSRIINHLMDAANLSYKYLFFGIAAIVPGDNPVISIKISRHNASTKLRSNYTPNVVGGKRNPV